MKITFCLQNNSTETVILCILNSSFQILYGVLNETGAINDDLIKGSSGLRSLECFKIEFHQQNERFW